MNFDNFYGIVSLFILATYLLFNSKVCFYIPIVLNASNVAIVNISRSYLPFHYGQLYHLVYIVCRFIHTAGLIMFFL